MPEVGSEKSFPPPNREGRTAHRQAGLGPRLETRFIDRSVEPADDRVTWIAFSVVQGDKWKHTTRGVPDT